MSKAMNKEISDIIKKFLPQESVGVIKEVFDDYENIKKENQTLKHDLDKAEKKQLKLIKDNKVTIKEKDLKLQKMQERIDDIKYKEEQINITERKLHQKGIELYTKEMDIFKREVEVKMFEQKASLLEYALSQNNTILHTIFSNNIIKETVTKSIPITKEKVIPVLGPDGFPLRSESGGDMTKKQTVVEHHLISETKKIEPIVPDFKPELDQSDITEVKSIEEAEQFFLRNHKDPVTVYYNCEKKICYSFLEAKKYLELIESGRKY